MTAIDLDSAKRQWLALQLIPLTIRMAGEGVSMQTLLRRVTGLSQAHLSTKGVTVVDPRREQLITDSLRGQTKADIAALGFDGAELEARWAGVPQTPLAAFAYTLQLSTGLSFALSTQYGGEIDSLASAVLEALIEEDVDGWRQGILGFLDAQADLFGEVDGDSPGEELREAIAAAMDWSDVLAVSRKVVDLLWWSFAAGLDLEFTTQYLSSFRPVPTLHLLWPRLTVPLTSDIKLGRGVVITPAQALLQLLWLVARRGYTGKWASTWPGAFELLQDTGLGELEHWQVRKYFSGHKWLSPASCREIWQGLCETASGGEAVAAPALWIIMGIWMQRCLFQRSGTPLGKLTFMIPDEEAYRAIWWRQNRRWAASLPVAGSAPWPSWLRGQSSDCSALRSSQSSGRSS